MLFVGPQTYCWFNSYKISFRHKMITMSIVFIVIIVLMKNT